MARKSKTQKRSLDDRFDFAEVAYPGAAGVWQSHLRPAVGTADGERYLLRLFKKSGTALDDDLRRLVARSVRRIRRVLSSRHASDLLAEVREIAEDDEELAIVMLDPGTPVAGSRQTIRARQDDFLSPAGRKIFWRNLKRVADALAICHNAGIIHGAVSANCMFSHGEGNIDYRLGGYETSLHIEDGDLADSDHALRPASAISFQQDWIDLGQTASTILGVTDEAGPSLHSIERRMLDRLINPPKFQLFNGAIVQRELTEVVEELDRLGSSSDGELLLFPASRAMRSDLPALTSASITADDADAILKFVESNLRDADARIQPRYGGGFEIVTDLAVYHISLATDRIGKLDKATKRRPNDPILDAFELSRPVRLCRNRQEADTRVRNIGPGAMRWADVNRAGQGSNAGEDVTSWRALVVLEAFTWLREQFRLYPVDVELAAEGDEVLLLPRVESHRDARRGDLGLRSTAEAMKHELQRDDGKTQWTITRTDHLADEEHQPELRYLGDGDALRQNIFTFSAGEPIIPGTYYLRPRRDRGFETATRRRLRNILAARGNVELLGALDDPARVAFDDTLRDIAAPGLPPEDMDPTKKKAWEAIASGQPINLVVGPPGVGKTYLISHLARSILAGTPDARILISAQNHETLAQVEQELGKTLSPDSIVVRVDRTNVSEDASALREASVDLLQSAANPEVSADPIMSGQIFQIRQGLNPAGEEEQAIADRILRDTDYLLLRSADITLATTSSYVIEEMIADGEQFDWVIIEEAARANGAELIGPLLLGNRRLMIGDHNQLMPFDIENRQKFYTGDMAAILLEGARTQLARISDLPEAVNETVERIESDPGLFEDVLATASRLEEAFGSIANRENERQKANGRPSSIVKTLREQSRMHPAISQLVSKTFYNGDLDPTDRVINREPTIEVHGAFPTTPVVILDLPALSTVKRRMFEQRQGSSYKNRTEAAALIAALKYVRPRKGEDAPVTLAILSPYLAQVKLLEQLLAAEIDTDSGTFNGFQSPRQDGRFVYTSDSFQGSEADVIVAGLVRNNTMVGNRALGFVRNRQRMNVLLSRAKQKLILCTSLQFIQEAVDGIDPQRINPQFEFLRTMRREIETLANPAPEGTVRGAAIVRVDPRGDLLL